MQFFNTLVFLGLLAGTAFAQFTQIVSPTAGSTLTSGSDITVQIGMADAAENIDNGVIMIGLAPCGSTCPTASENLGDVLYKGVFNPNTNGGGYFYENFTVTVPQIVPAGKASLNVIHVFLIGDSFETVIDYLNETLTVVS